MYIIIPYCLKLQRNHVENDKFKREEHVKKNHNNDLKYLKA